ncbi:MAG: hypothetical protein ABW321_00695 [Polyangiales bacterium]
MDTQLLPAHPGHLQGLLEDNRVQLTDAHALPSVWADQRPLSWVAGPKRL